ncbi:MAG TPA: hypothetical protein VH374_07680 [Polyangia bacterium]|nr:hypothetical protein [Polyangia bacterium]
MVSGPGRGTGSTSPSSTPIPASAPAGPRLGQRSIFHIQLALLAVHSLLRFRKDLVSISGDVPMPWRVYAVAREDDEMIERARVDHGSRNPCAAGAAAVAVFAAADTGCGTKKSAGDAGADAATIGSGGASGSGSGGSNGAGGVSFDTNGFDVNLNDLNLNDVNLNDLKLDLNFDLNGIDLNVATCPAGVKTGDSCANATACTAGANAGCLCFGATWTCIGT